MAGPADDTPRAACPEEETPPPEPAAPPAHRPPSGAADAPGGLTQIVRDIRDELAQITARELELRRRERELGRRYRNLSEATSRAAAQEPAESGQSLARLAAELNAQAVDIAARQARVDEITAQLRTQLAAGERPRQVAMTDHTGDRLPVCQTGQRTVLQVSWALRCTAFAALAGLLAGFAWYVAHPAAYRATTRVQIVTANPVVAEVLPPHRALLLDPHLLDTLPAETGLSSIWQVACADGRVTARADEGEPVLWLSVTARDVDTARRLTTAACTVYQQRLTDKRSATALRPAYQNLALLRERLEASLQTARQEQLEARAALATLPAAPDPAEVRVTADQLEADLAEVSTALDRGRTELAALAGQDDVRGSVAPAEIEQALARDTVYREDQQEFHAVALQYRTELAVALLQLDAPRKAMQKALSQLAATVEEQRGLDPPADVAAILDECLTTVSNAQARCASFAAEWQRGVDSVQAMVMGDDVAALVAQQGKMAEAARHAAEDADAVVDQVGARIEALSGGDGGTRRVVVGAVLKADHEALKAASEPFGAAAAKTALTENTQLDAHDRKLRGLQMRLNNRREAVRQQLQQAADRTAREQQTAQVAETRAQVRDLERRREELLTDQAAALRELRAADEAARRQDELAGQARQRDTEIAWLEARRAALVGELADGQQPGPGQERAEVGAPTLTAVAPGRVPNAVFAGAASFVAGWLVAALMVARWPRLPGRNRARGALSAP
jgi:hypothetical protein